jgi:hypothetical protein
MISHKVIFLIDRIHKKVPSGLGLKYSRVIYGIFLLVSFPPMFYNGDSLKERKGDLFSVVKIVNKEITL